MADRCAPADAPHFSLSRRIASLQCVAVDCSSISKQIHARTGLDRYQTKFAKVALYCVATCCTRSPALMIERTPETE